MNPIFRLIHSFTGGKDDCNKKRTSKNTSPSCVVEGYNLIYKNRFIVNVVLDVNWNICGRSKINYNRNKMYISDYQ